MRIIRLFLCVGLGTGIACVADLDVPRTVQIECNGDNDCPPGFACNTSLALCVNRDQNQPPTLSLGDARGEGNGRALRQVSLNFSIQDADLDDTLSISFEFSTDPEPDSPNALWTAATPLDPDSLSDLPPQHSGEFLWDVLSDAEANSGGLQSTEVTLADGTQSKVVAYASQVTLRALALDKEGASSTPLNSTSFSLGNDAPVITLQPFPEEQANLIVAEFELADSAGDFSGVEFEFREDGGDWRRADVSTLDVPSLLAPASGQSHQALWFSQTLPEQDPTVAQGIGFFSKSNVELRVRSYDEPQQDALGEPIRHAGPWSTQTIPLIRNQTPPQILSISAPREVFRGGTGPVLIEYQLLDLEADPVDVRVDFSTDLGQSWSPCNEDPTAHSEGFYNLASSPTALLHHFVWEPSGLFLQNVENVLVRIIASDGNNGETVGSAATALLQSPSPTLSSYLASTSPNACTDPALLDFVELTGDQTLDQVLVCATTVSVIPGAIDSDGISFDPANEITTALDATVNHDFVHHARLALIDNDNLLDLVTFGGSAFQATPDPTVIQLWLGQGDGSFAFVEEHLSLGAWFFLTDLVAADVDGDDDLDLWFIGNHQDPFGGDAELMLLENTGSPPPNLFAAPRSMLPVTGTPLSIAAGDFTGDGRSDLGIAGWSSGLTIFHDPQSAPPAVHSSYPLSTPEGFGAAAIEPQVVDIEGDGFLDIIFASQRSNGNRAELYVLPHQPNSSLELFGPLRTFPVSGAQLSISTANLNGDGALDLLLINNISQVEALLGENLAGQATGGFSSLSQLAQPTCGITTDLNRVAALDTNLDGLDEVFFYDACAGALSKLESQAQGGILTLSEGLENRSIQFFSGSKTIADINGDNLLDWVDGGNAYLSGAGDGRFADSTFNWTSGVASDVSSVDSVLPVDIDQDGDLEFVVAWRRLGETDKRVAIVDDITADATVLTESETLQGAVAMQACDLDGDGDLDLAVTQAWPNGPDEVAVLHNEGLDAPLLGSVDRVPVGTSPFALGCADFNLDGRDDLVVTDYDLDQQNETFAYVLLANPLSADGFGRMPPVDVGGLALDIVTGDLDDDGIPDIVVAGQSGGLQILMGQGDGSFTPGDGILVDADAVRLADLNFDGVLDISATGRAPSGVRDLYFLIADQNQGLGTGTFTLAPSSPGNTEALGVWRWDANADGIVDLATGGTLHQSFLGQFEGMGTSPLRTLASTDLSAPAFIGPLPPTTTDRFGAPLLPPTLGTRLFHIDRGGTVTDLLPELQRSGLTLPNRLLPLSRGWIFEGDVYLKRVRETDPIGTRLQPLARGTLVQGIQGPEVFTLEGPSTEHLGFAIDIPLISARSLPTPSKVRVYQRIVDWRRANEVPSDMLFNEPDAQRYLPSVNDNDGFRDIIAQKFLWREIPPDSNGDLSDGEGARYVLLDTGSSEARVRIHSERLGLFQAFGTP